MAYQEVGGSKEFIKYKDCEAGDVLVEGVFRREYQGKFGVQYEFEAMCGKIVVLNSAGQLNYKMDFIKPGTKLKIIYEGTVVLDKGLMKGKSSHQFKVLKDTAFDGEIGTEDEGLPDFEAGEEEGELDLDDLDI